MKNKQISVFIENKEGKLKNAIEALSKENINIRALSIADTAKFGILRLIVSDNKKAKEVLEENNFIVKESEVIIVEVPDEPNGLNTILTYLDDEDINLEYLYAFVSSKSDEAIVVMRLENIEEGIKVLKSKNANILTEEDIKNI
ncbi:MAG: amino acid-binding protein [Methanobrevibacter sp.]|nr:amino acid-binding protein [Methanobrevibacter sp.]